MIPCRPIVVTDAGFKNPWFSKVRTLGWDYVGRANAHVLVISAEASEQELDDCARWTKARTLFEQARRRAKDLGETIVAKSNPLSSRLVLVKGPKKTMKSSPGPKKRRSKTIEHYRHRATAPWLLQSSIYTVQARDIVRWYSTRMRIEETFRDMKSHRFGLSLEDARTHAGKFDKQSERYTVLLLLATLGLLSLTLAGQVAVRLGQAQSFQANTTRSKRVLSLVFLGRRFLDRIELKEIEPYRFLQAWVDLRLMIAELSGPAIVAEGN